jgi:Flp pilus assembly protein protease CpaA
VNVPTTATTQPPPSDVALREPVARGGNRLAIDPSVAWIAGLSLAAVMASGLQIANQRPDQGYFVTVLAFLVLGTAAALDVGYRRIPNALTYPAIVLGLGFNVIAPAIGKLIEGGAYHTFLTWLGGAQPRDGLIGFAVCAGFGIVSFILRGVGGGDAKALGAFGALLGFARAWPALFNCLMIGAAISVLNLLLAGRLIRKLQELMGALFVAAILKKRPDHVTVFSNREAPFVLSLFLGFALAQFVELHHLVFGFVE